MNPLVIQRPTAVRVAAAATLLIIIAWAATSGGTGDFGVLAYPAIIALQTAREFLWRMEVTKRGLHERPGIGPRRDIEWKSVEGVIMPNSAWWRVNPVLKVMDAPNIQMSYADDIGLVIDLAVKKGKKVEGTAASITMIRTLFPWLVLLALASLLLGAQLAGGTA